MEATTGKNARPRCLTIDAATGYRCPHPATHRKRCGRHYRALMRRNPAVQAAERDRKLQARYGITAEQADALLAERDWCCELCGRGAEEFERGLCLDHDHETGTLRGVLCPIHNAGFGSTLSESTQVWQRAQEYLERAARLRDHAVTGEESTEAA